MGNPPNDGPCEVTITAPDKEWLQGFARRLVEDRLAAAAHMDQMHTTYRWGGKVVDAEEARVVLHTTFNRVPQIVERIRRLHPYEVPCVAARPLVAGDEEYLDWIGKESRLHDN